MELVKQYYIIILVALILFFITIIFSFDNCRTAIIKAPIIKEINLLIIK